MYKKTVVSLLVTLTIILILLIPSCKTTETITEKTISSGTQAHWWEAIGTPQYGGTITCYGGNNLATSFDPYMAFQSSAILYDRLFWTDWTLPRDTMGLTTYFIQGEFVEGLLADTWEWTAPQTLMVHLKKGIHWQNKPPLNGRELVANDVVQHYNRLLGLGDYTEPSPFYGTQKERVESISAVDDYTVIFKFKVTGDLLNFNIVVSSDVGPIEAPELVKTEGALDDWTKAVGTGPWMITSLQSTIELTAARNPDYFCFDERYPENRLPYADTYRIVVIPEMTTAITALRTGKIDYIDNPTWQQVDALTMNNPELQSVTIPLNGWCLMPRVDKVPFTDIKVRKALQLAINLDDIYEGYYGGNAGKYTCGMTNPVLADYCIPYEDWPQELRDEYSYNPTKAKQLLSDAGYPDGFKTKILTNSSYMMDLQIIEVVKSYFLDIGVDMEIEVMDAQAMRDYVSAGKHEALTQSFGIGTIYPPDRMGFFYLSQSFNNTSYVSDSYYDDLMMQTTNADTAEFQGLIKKMDRYALEQHWSINLLPRLRYNVWQPYLKGYTNEWVDCNGIFYFTRMWVDQDLKKSMGRGE